MSRIGKKPIEIPAGVEVSVNGDLVKVKGAKATRELKLGAGVGVKVENNEVILSLTSKDKQARSNYGTMRARIANMILGVTEGFKKAIELQGVGYTAKLAGKVLILNTGYSHEVKLDIPDGLVCKVQKELVEMESADEVVLGQFAAKARDVHPPEPYLGKGVRYQGEHVRRKAGKTGK